MDENMTTTNPAEEETHRNLIEVIIDFWIEGFNFLKFLFYDLFIGNY